jgi:hypothetical protein
VDHVSKESDYPHVVESTENCLMGQLALSMSEGQLNQATSQANKNTADVESAHTLT